jgi:hypothetical protein
MRAHEDAVAEDDFQFMHIAGMHTAADDEKNGSAAIANDADTAMATRTPSSKKGSSVVDADADANGDAAVAPEPYATVAALTRDLAAADTKTQLLSLQRLAHQLSASNKEDDGDKNEDAEAFVVANVATTLSSPCARVFEILKQAPRRAYRK